MIFITGPLFSGKEAYIRAKLQWDDEMFCEHAVRDVQDLARDCDELEALADTLSEKMVVISTEIGGGVIPVAQDERRWREKAGHLQCLLAQRASVVIRVCCGLPQILKGTLDDVH